MRIARHGIDCEYRDSGYYFAVNDPGKLTQVETFRVGCIGHVNQAEMQAAVNAVGQVLQEMEVFDI